MTANLTSGIILWCPDVQACPCGVGAYRKKGQNPALGTTRFPLAALSFPTCKVDSASLRIAEKLIGGPLPPFPPTARGGVGSLLQPLPGFPEATGQASLGRVYGFPVTMDRTRV